MLGRLILFSILSGLALFLSWPPHSGGLTFFIFIALVPLLVLESYIEKKIISYKHYLYSAYLTFFIFNSFTTFWIQHAHIGGAIFAILCNSFFMALVFYFYAKIKNAIKWRNTAFILPILWVAFEYLHLNWDLSWPWLTFGNVFAAHPNWVQWYSFTGVLGGTFWVFVINILFFKLYMNRSCSKQIVQYVIFIGLCFLVPLLLSNYIYNKNVSYLNRDLDSVNVLVVQPNINPYTEKFSFSQNKQLDDLELLINSHLENNLDYILLPETFLVQPIWEHLLLNNSSIKRLNKLADTNQFDIIVGATTLGLSTQSPTAQPLLDHGDSWYQVYNSALCLRGTDFTINTYHKSKLVPGAEQMPFQNILYPIFGNHILTIGDSYSIGNYSKQDTINIFNSSIAPIICYESIYGEYVGEFVKKGAQVIFIITNDGWWKKTSGYRQHSMYAKLRAIETRRYIARSANTGISSIINPLGELEKSLDWNVQGVIKANIKLNTEITFYVKYGDFLGRLSAFLSVLFLLYYFTSNKLRFSGK